MGTDRADGVKAIGTTLEILRVLRETNGAGVTEVANELDVSKSTVHDHLATLRDRGFVEKNGTTYDLGLSWLRFGGHARDNLELFQHAQVPVLELAQETEELALVSAYHRMQSIPIYHARGAKAVTTDSYAGLELPIHCTATGKAMLAALSDADVETILDSVTLEAHAKNTIVDKGELWAEIERTRERGYSLDDEERIDGLRGIGAAVTHESTGTVLGGLAITGPTHRIDGDRYTEEYPQLVANMAREIEINIRYQQSQPG